MKYIVALQNKADMLKAKLTNKAGQNTVEYVMMLGVVLVVAGLAMVAMRSMMPEVFESIKAKILGGINNINS